MAIGSIFHLKRIQGAVAKGSATGRFYGIANFVIEGAKYKRK